MPRGSSVLQEWDEVLAITSPEAAQQLDEMLAAATHPDRDEERESV